MHNLLLSVVFLLNWSQPVKSIEESRWNHIHDGTIFLLDDLPGNDPQIYEETNNIHRAMKNLCIDYWRALPRNKPTFSNENIQKWEANKASRKRNDQLIKMLCVRNRVKLELPDLYKGDIQNAEEFFIKILWFPWQLRKAHHVIYNRSFNQIEHMRTGILKCNNRLSIFKLLCDRILLNLCGENCNTRTFKTVHDCLSSILYTLGCICARTGCHLYWNTHAQNIENFRALVFFNRNELYIPQYNFFEWPQVPLLDYDRYVKILKGLELSKMHKLFYPLFQLHYYSSLLLAIRLAEYDCNLLDHEKKKCMQVFLDIELLDKLIHLLCYFPIIIGSSKTILTNRMFELQPHQIIKEDNDLLDYFSQNYKEAYDKESPSARRDRLFVESVHRSQDALISFCEFACEKGSIISNALNSFVDKIAKLFVAFECDLNPYDELSRMFSTSFLNFNDTS